MGGPPKAMLRQDDLLQPLPHEVEGHPIPDEERLARTAGGTDLRFRSGLCLTGLVLILLALISCDWVFATDNATKAPHASSTPPTSIAKENALDFLLGTSLRQEIIRAISSVQGRLRELATIMQKHGNATQNTNLAVLPLLPNEIRNFEAETEQTWRKVLSRFLEAHSEAEDVLTSVLLPASHVTATLLLLKALTDPRVLDIGVEAARTCVLRPSPQCDLTCCLQRHASAKESMFRQLRQELLPTIFQVRVEESLQAVHVKCLNEATVRRSTDMFGWHAEMEVHSRRLQPPDVFTSSPVFPPWKQLPPSPDHSPGYGGSVIPTNWFTIGAPVISNILGLVFLSLMALLPDRGGFFTNRAANYALWGVQGATTFGECLANIGFPNEGVVYFAPCIIDIMFFGLEVIWVFFDGDVAGPSSQDRCSPYSTWPQLRGGCGNCIGIVPGGQFDNRCDVYCESFGHTSEFAASAQPGSCIPQARYAKQQHIPFSFMLCQCLIAVRQLSKYDVEQQGPKLNVSYLRGPQLEREHRHPQGKFMAAARRLQENASTIPCPPYSAWPPMMGACGSCEALVVAASYNSSCDHYCSSFGLACVAAGSGTCSMKTQVSCNEHTSIDELGMLCTCQGWADVPLQCSSFATWSHVDVNLCGNCTAAVSQRVLSSKFGSTCDQYCKSFQHRCSAAAVQGSTACSVAQPLHCSEPVQDVTLDVLCRCVTLF